MSALFDLMLILLTGLIIMIWTWFSEALEITFSQQTMGYLVILALSTYFYFASQEEEDENN